jgi:hypothetical protein
MRSACSALLLICACGTLSNEDVQFLEAMPQKDQLHVQVPKGDTSQPACALGSADVWTSAKTTGDAINAGVDGILGLIDNIRAVPPTTRDTDLRTWGPFPDKDHKGVQIKVTMERELDATGTPWRWIYTIAANDLPFLEGEFFGAAAKNGIGRMTLHFENAWTLGINKPTDPKTPMKIFYDLSTDPKTISLDLTSGIGFGLASFDYGWAGYADGHGRFDYAIPQSNGCLLEVTANFTAKASGRLTYRALCPLGLVYGDIVQCFDISACLTYVNDPFAFTAQCNGVKPCVLGDAASCAQ